MSGPASDIREFNFYTDYLWSPTDFLNLQTWLQNEIRGIALGVSGQSLLSGCLATPGGGLLVSVSDGVAIDSFGRIVVVTGANVAVAEPVGNPAKTLIVLRPKLVDMTSIPLPDAPMTNVFLHEKLSYDLLALNGTPAGSPVYPTPQANDIVVAALIIPDSTVTLLASMFDRSKISLPLKRVNAYNSVSAAYSVLATDSHVDGDATAAPFTATLPPASTVPGQDFTFVKTDSGANALSVAGNGGDLISGQSSWDLSDQWATLKVRSIGTSWRII